MFHSLVHMMVAVKYGCAQKIDDFIIKSLLENFLPFGYREQQKRWRRRLLILICMRVLPERVPPPSFELAQKFTMQRHFGSGHLHAIDKVDWASNFVLGYGAKDICSITIRKRAFKHWKYSQLDNCSLDWFNQMSQMCVSDFEFEGNGKKKLKIISCEELKSMNKLCQFVNRKLIFQTECVQNRHDLLKPFVSNRQKSVFIQMRLNSVGNFQNI